MADTVVKAADTTIFNSRGLWGPYWVSPLIGCIIYVDANVDIAASKTTDGGATWGTAVVLEAATVDQMQAVFDRQVVGDTGDKVHIVYTSGATDLLRYSNYDISADAWATVVSTAHNASGTDNANKVFITKTKSGNILCGAVNSATASTAVKLASPWSAMSAITSPAESNANDATLGGVYVSGTGDDNDGGIFFWDTSANAISVKMYDDSANTWTETAIASGHTLNTTQHGWASAVRHSDGVTVLAAWTDIDPATAIADLKVYTVLANSIAAPTVATKTDVVTNVQENAECDVFIDQTTDDIYVTYLLGTTFTSVVSVLYRKSTDDAATWSGASDVDEDAEDDHRLLGSSHMAAADGGRFQPVWFNDDTNNIYNNLNTDISIAASGGTTHNAAAVLAATGVVASLATATYAVASALSAAGTVTPLAKLNANASSALSVSATVAAVSTLTLGATSALATTVTVSAEATATYAAASAVSATVSITAATVVTHSALAALATSAALAADSSLLVLVDAAVAGSATLAALAAVEHNAAAVLAGAVTVASGATATYAATSVLAAAVTVASGATATYAAASAHTSTATLDAVTIVTHNASAALAASVTVAAAADVEGAGGSTHLGEALLSAQVSLSSDATASYSAVAALATVAALAAAGSAAYASAAALLAEAVLVAFSLSATPSIINLDGISDSDVDLSGNSDDTVSGLVGRSAQRISLTANASDTINLEGNRP